MANDSCNTSRVRSHSFDKWCGTFKGAVLWATVFMTLCRGEALSQSHQGSASTKDLFISKKTPDARIQIKSATTVYVIQVDLPRALDSDLEKSDSRWKVSLELLSMQLCDQASAIGGDKLKVVYSDPTTIKAHAWKKNESYAMAIEDEAMDVSENVMDVHPGESRELINIQANQLVLIPEGRWIKSGADLIATLYQDPLPDGTCYNNTFPCLCDNPNPYDSLEDEADPEVVTRCIPKSLICNGQPNCGFGCRYDESDESCTNPVESSLPPIESCDETDSLTSTTPSSKTTFNEDSSSSSSRVSVHTVNFVLAIVALMSLVKL